MLSNFMFDLFYSAMEVGALVGLPVLMYSAVEGVGMIFDRIVYGVRFLDRA